MVEDLLFKKLNKLVSLDLLPKASVLLLIIEDRIPQRKDFNSMYRDLPHIRIQWFFSPERQLTKKVKFLILLPIDWNLLRLRSKTFTSMWLRNQRKYWERRLKQLPKKWRHSKLSKRSDNSGSIRDTKASVRRKQESKQKNKQKTSRNSKSEWFDRLIMILFNKFRSIC